jgi:hypothetical protein
VPNPPVSCSEHFWELNLNLVPPKELKIIQYSGPPSSRKRHARTRTSATSISETPVTRYEEPVTVHRSSMSDSHDSRGYKETPPATASGSHLSQPSWTSSAESLPSYDNHYLQPSSYPATPHGEHQTMNCYHPVTIDPIAASPLPRPAIHDLAPIKGHAHCLYLS